MVRLMHDKTLSFLLLLYAISRKSQARNLFFYVKVCYTEIAALLHSILWREEVRPMSEILSFVLSVAAGVVANYVYKWLDEQDKDGKH